MPKISTVLSVFKRRCILKLAVNGRFPTKSNYSPNPSFPRSIPMDHSCCFLFCHSLINECFGNTARSLRHTAHEASGHELKEWGSRYTSINFHHCYHHIETRYENQLFFMHLLEWFESWTTHHVDCLPSIAFQMTIRERDELIRTFPHDIILKWDHFKMMTALIRVHCIRSDLFRRPIHQTWFTQCNIAPRVSFD